MGTLNLSKIPKVTCCCFGSSLRVGSLIISWVGLVVSVFASALCVLGLVTNLQGYHHDELMTALFVIGMIWSCISSFLCLLLLVGVNQKNANILKPGIAFYAFFNVILWISNVGLFVSVFSNPLLIAALFISVLITGLNFHWLQVLVSFYHSISRPTVQVV